MSNKILAVVGLTGSGKSEAAAFLSQKGYFKIRFGDLTDEELRRRNLETNEQNEREIREFLRQEHGMAAFAKLNLSKIDEAIKNSPVVIDGLYSWEEYTYLKEKYGDNLVIIGVFASPALRYKRLSQRSIRPLGNDESKNRDYAEIEKINKGGPIAMADYVLINDSNLQNLYRQIDNMLDNKAEQKPAAKRPSRKEYYAEIAREIARRSTCLSSHFGAVIVRDDQIIATGYNGAPRKTMDCTERGVCLRRNLGIPSGQRYEICRSVHAEMNAIINAARAGVSLLGGDLYIYSEKVFEGKNKIISAIPCFICKKMIINAGLNHVISRMDDNRLEIFDVADWALNWQKKDMLNDVDKYDAKYYSQSEPKKTALENNDNKIALNVKKINSDAILPDYAYPGDAGLDLYSMENYLLKTNERKIFNTGISLEIPKGFVGLIWDKSGLASRAGITILGGVVDNSYRGEIQVILHNSGQEEFQIYKGDKIAQILIQPVAEATIETTDDLSHTEREARGFGSTARPRW